MNILVTFLKYDKENIFLDLQKKDLVQVCSYSYLDVKQYHDKRNLNMEIFIFIFHTSFLESKLFILIILPG